MKKFLVSLLLIICSLGTVNANKIDNVNASELGLASNRAYILIDLQSGKTLLGENTDEQMPVASIVKLMTILLTLEEIGANNISVDDMVSVSENASHMGGSQIFLDANCEYKVGELLKSVIVCSANDSSVALAEHLAGSEELFVDKMNDKAKELEMKHTVYKNATGLPCEGQYSCANDVAVVLSKVLSYDLYHTYCSIWLEDFAHPSGRTTEMTNTNRLVRFYEGCIGGKTGSTDEAKYCLGAGATRKNMSLVAVVLGSETSKDRFSNVTKLLDYGFANYENKVLFSNENLKDTKVLVNGKDEIIPLYIKKECNIVVKKGEELDIKTYINLPTAVTSIEKDEVVGNVEILINDEEYATIDILSSKTIDEASLLDYINKIKDDFVA